MKRFICSVAYITLLIFSLLPDIAFAQKANRSGATAKPQRSSSITGRVVGEGGQPLADTTVFVSPASSLDDGSDVLSSILRPITTDIDGRFEIKDLAPRAYIVSAVVPGYIASGNSLQNYYRPGDTVTISMTKGGVITGKVTNATGDPLVGIRMRATRIKDADNRPIRINIANLSSSNEGEKLMWEWTTDDRGIYRIYGLEPGIYTVAAGGKGLVSIQRNGYDGSTATYHPSSTADTAAEVIVRAGVETSNIDIRYREGVGSTLSGIISGATSDLVMVITMRALSGMPENLSFALPSASGNSFMLDSMTDGDYYLYAISMSSQNGGDISASKPKRISVKGSDITGIELVLSPLASISGRVVIEPVAKSDCKPLHPPSVQELVIKAQSDRKEKLRDEPDSILWAYNNSAPNEKGEFQIQFLEQGLKRLSIHLPGEDHYMRSITLPGSTPNAKPSDAAKDGLNLKGGDKVTGLTITLSEGAAAISGKLSLPKDDPTPISRLRIYLLPAEHESADNLLRYFEAPIQPDAAFKLTNLAPGQYWIIARPIMEEESVENFRRPMAWDAADRMGLRFEGEATNTVIELKQCERISDYIVKYQSPAKPKK